MQVEAATELVDEIERRTRARLREIEINKRRYDKDFPVFAADCLTIRPKKGGDSLFRLNDVQRYVHEKIEDQKKRLGKVRILILKARKPGVSTYVEGRYYHRVSRSKGLRAFIMTHEQDATNEIFEMTERFHEHNPEAPHTGAANAKELFFDILDSGFRVGTAGSKGIGRGGTPQFFHGSEVAHWPNSAEHAAGILQSIPDEPGTEIILESTANGAIGLFYNMSKSAMAKIGEYELIFIPWAAHGEYRKEPPTGWKAPDKFVEYGALHSLDAAQLYWAYLKNADLAAADALSPDEVCWRFKQEYPMTAEEAFRASRKGSYISADAVQRARKLKAPDQSHAPRIIGCDFACGGGDDEIGESGDANLFIDRQGRALGRKLYRRFRDKNTVTVANRLQQDIDDLKPDMCFLDAGGGGASVYDILKARGYEDVLTLVNFGGEPNDKRKYRNKSTEMSGLFRDWIMDEGGADIPDEDLLDSEIVSVRVTEDTHHREMQVKKKETRKEFGFSPDGFDASKLTFAAPIKKMDRKRLSPLHGAGGNASGWQAA